MVRLISVFAMLIIMDGLAKADCGGRVRATPVRNLIASRPILTTLQKIRANVVRSSCSSPQAVQSGCCGHLQVIQSSCSGQIQASCSGATTIVSNVPPPMPKAVKLVSAPAVVDVVINTQIRMEEPPICNGTSCELVRTPILSAMSSAYQQALASAQYRAANRIKGHTYLDTHRTSGVGWSTSNPKPKTCLGVGGSAYAVVQGPDGWYATKFAD